MTLPVFHKGTKPSASYTSVTINSAGWTQLWGTDLARSFAAVLGGTGTPGEIIYISANNTALITDPDVAVSDAVRGPLYFETRGTNPLYARINAGSLLVRTTTSVQAPKSPVPGGLIGTKSYKVITECGGKAVTYVGGVGGIGGAHAMVLVREDDRLRATLMGNQDLIMIASNYDDPQIIPLITVGSFTSSGPFFPGPLPVEGVDELNLLDFGGVGQQTAAYWISDKMVAI